MEKNKHYFDEKKWAWITEFEFKKEPKNVLMRLWKRIYTCFTILFFNDAWTLYLKTWHPTFEKAKTVRIEVSYYKGDKTC
ncbi:MAG: hypothetical protein WCW65_02695 [Candidatus Paceibacterota bacterium]